MTATGSAEHSRRGTATPPETEAGGGLEWPVVRWPGWIGLVLALVGLGASIWLTYAHYTTATTLACPENGFINCAKVTTSQYSHFLGLPVSVLGLAFFVAMVPLQLPAAWRVHWAPLRAARLAGCAVGVAMVVWLLYAELFLLDNLCLYCTVVHAMTVLLFVTTALGTVATAPVPLDEH